MQTSNIFSFVDLTSLNDTDTTETISVLCQTALEKKVAAVCVLPKFVSQAVSLLKNSSIDVATVANFPAGDMSFDVVLDLIEESLLNGAQEMDVVFPYQKYLAGKKRESIQFIRECKQTCGEKILKVILETGALKDPKLIAEISHEVILAGANFLKTSTGKIEVGATLEAAKIMLQEIKKSSLPVGFKASGGIRSIEVANQYLALAQDIMGADWVSPATFRIGASRLI